MHECCTVPIDQIMTNEHKPDGVCCLVSDVTEALPLTDCPESGNSSRKIQPLLFVNLAFLSGLGLLGVRESQIQHGNLSEMA